MWKTQIRFTGARELAILLPNGVRRDKKWQKFVLKITSLWIVL